MGNRSRSRSRRPHDFDAPNLRYRPTVLVQVFDLDGNLIGELWDCCTCRACRRAAR